MERIPSPDPFQTTLSGAFTGSLQTPPHEGAPSTQPLVQQESTPEMGLPNLVQTIDPKDAHAEEIEASRKRLPQYNTTTRNRFLIDTKERNIEYCIYPNEHVQTAGIIKHNGKYLVKDPSLSISGELFDSIEDLRDALHRNSSWEDIFMSKHDEDSYNKLLVHENTFFINDAGTKIRSSFVKNGVMCRHTSKICRENGKFFLPGITDPESHKIIGEGYDSLSELKAALNKLGMNDVNAVAAQPKST